LHYYKRYKCTDFRLLEPVDVVEDVEDEGAVDHQLGLLDTELVPEK
jgi:hypothetical protein